METRNRYQDDVAHLVPRPDEESRIRKLMSAFRDRFGGSDSSLLVVRAPLRICPLGAHTDHQLGIVTGMTIDHSVLMVVSPSNDRRVLIESLNFPGRVEFSLDAIPPKEDRNWGNYPRGAALGLQQFLREQGDRGALLQGFKGIIESDMPVGGLSSSAAVTASYLLAFEEVNDLRISPLENVGLVRSTENNYIGLNNGILDQSIILCGRRNALTRVDCREAAVSHVETPEIMPAYAIMIVYSGTSRQLVGTDYNTRVAECTEAARLLLEKAGQSGVPFRLRNVPEEIFESCLETLPPVLMKRARHFRGEMLRVREGVSAWGDGDIIRVGELISESGRSSIENYECGSPHMITLYETLSSCPGVYGTRFSGAGFRGSCLALVDPLKFEAIAEILHERYTALHPEFKESYSIHACAPDDSAGAAIRMFN